MATRIRPKVSEKNPYSIEKHRYYELKHFCLQYTIWKRLYLSIDGYGSSFRLGEIRKTSIADLTEKAAEKRLYLRSKMELVEQAAVAADPDLWGYILKGVTEELSYNALKTRLDIPCGKDMYYERYRKFFWILDKTRN